MSSNSWRGRRPDQSHADFVRSLYERDAVAELFEAVEEREAEKPQTLKERRLERQKARMSKLSRKTDLTGEDIKYLLAALGVSHGKFQRDVGWNQWASQRILNGQSDGDIPLWVELVLLLYIVDDVSREEQGPIVLPLEEYGFKLPSRAREGADRPAPEDA